MVIAHNGDRPQPVRGASMYSHLVCTNSWHFSCHVLLRSGLIANYLDGMCEVMTT